MDKYVLKEYYVKYLRDIRGLKESSIRHYLDALRYISNYLKKLGKIHESIFEVHDIGELELLRQYLKEDLEFMSLDKRGHQMYSSGLNNYLRFAEGEQYDTIEGNIVLFDIEVAPDKPEQRVYQYWKRLSIVKLQSIKTAKYKCEMDGNHRTFTSKTTRFQYMEGHHAIPMKLQSLFVDKSLDTYANVVCLCPICHRLIHYGIDDERESIIDKIYNDRADRLANCGIRVSRDEFKKLVDM